MLGMSDSIGMVGHMGTTRTDTAAKSIYYNLLALNIK